MRAQSLKFGTKIFTETVAKVDLKNRPFKIWLENKLDSVPIETDSIIIATGATAKRVHNFLLL